MLNSSEMVEDGYDRALRPAWEYLTAMRAYKNRFTGKVVTDYDLAAGFSSLPFLSTLRNDWSRIDGE